MNRELLSSYCKKILLPYSKKMKINSFIFIMDSALCHLKDFETFKQELNNETLIIPKGATYLLQPIDLCIGKPIKDKVRNLFSNWFQENHEKYTAKGNIRNPSHEELLGWIENAQNDSTAELLKKSFNRGKLLFTVCSWIYDRFKK